MSPTINIAHIVIWIFGLGWLIYYHEGSRLCGYDRPRTSLAMSTCVKSIFPAFCRHPHFQVTTEVESDDRDDQVIVGESEAYAGKEDGRGEGGQNVDEKK